MLQHRLAILLAGSPLPGSSGFRLAPSCSSTVLESFTSSHTDTGKEHMEDPTRKVLWQVLGKGWHVGPYSLFRAHHRSHPDVRKAER